ncbi:MAG: PAS domain S-box protein, partial [Betaproteobacteria bacterium]|nr:PAS domain S-box protein [Betaproteobacteria bacterium]
AISFRLDGVRRVREANLARLAAMKAYFEASDSVRREEFEAMAADRFSASETHSALAYAPRVRAAGVPAWRRQAIREAGRDDIAIWENSPAGGPVPAGAREEYFPVTFVAPAARARLITGFDVASEPVRRAAVDNAIATGEAVLARPRDEPGEGAGSRGFILLRAVYTKGPPPVTVPERRQRAMGVVISRFVYGGIMRQALGESPALGLYHFVYADDDPAARPVVFRQPRQKPARPGPAPAADLTLAELRSLPDATVVAVTEGGWSAVYGFVPAADLSLAAHFGSGQVLVAAGGAVVSLLAALGAMLLVRKSRDARIQSRRFEGFFRMSPVPAGMADLSNGTIAAVNEEWQRQFGYTEAEVVGKPILDMEVSTPESLKEDLAVLEKDRRYDLVSKSLRNKSGEIREHLVTSHVIEIGGRDYILWMSLDVTERNRAQRALEASEARLRFLLSATPVVIYTARLGAPRVMTYVSENVNMVLGYLPDEVTQVPAAWAGSVHPEDLQQVIDHLADLPQRGELSIDYRMRRKDGEYRWVHDESRVVPGPPGAPGEAIGCLVDITEFHDVRERLALSEKMEAIGQLTGGLAHDFNNLLGIIIGNLDLMAMDLPEDGEVRKSLDAALATAMRGAELSRRLLAVARRESFTTQRFRLAEHLSTLLPLLERTIGRSISLEWRVDFDGEVRVDPGELDNVLINLAVNARDAMPRGGRLLVGTDERIVVPSGSAVDDLAPGRYVRIRVSDTGEGMTPEVRRRAIEPFFTTKGRARGTGLGLAMAFGFARRAGGSLSIYSEPGKGTTITILLPACTDEARAAVAGPEAGQALPHGTERVLVVDDERELATVAQRWLASLGYAAQACHSAEEALGLLAAGEPFDLLLTDIVMPGKDGLQLAREATDLRPGIAVLLTSGFSHELLSGANGGNPGWPLLDKPYRQVDLAVAVRQAIDRGGTAAEISGPAAATS